VRKVIQIATFLCGKKKQQNISNSAAAVLHVFVCEILLDFAVASWLAFQHLRMREQKKQSDKILLIIYKFQENIFPFRASTMNDD
jgi:hypothetical protein